MSRGSRRVGSLALALVACSTPRSAPTLTVRGGTPEGVRVTAAELPAVESPELRLASELCRREEACGRLGRAGRYPSFESCLSDRESLARRELSTWACSPAASRARFEECLASVRTEPCSTNLERADRLATCRANAVCAP